MSKLMLIDAVHPEETRVALVADGRVDDFDFEAAGKRQLRGNIYLAKVTRVEPSLQAAFVEYGGNRHGFLAFSEIHPDYYQLPQEDREALLREEAELAAAEAEDDEVDDPSEIEAEDDEDTDAENEAETEEDNEASEDNDETEADADKDEKAASEPRHRRKRAHPSRRYKIQEVIRRRQVMLIQVVKEERGNKGAALTTYLSLAGRYCVLMPNTPRGGGISRKISHSSDRKRLKTITKNLDVPQGMGLIVRTAGAKRTKTDIKRDFDYLQKLWDSIREKTLTSMAPTLVNEEGGLVHRAMRDLYDKDVDEVLIQGEPAYREAKDLARLLMPSQARKVKQWKDPSPLFVAKRVEEQLDSIFSPVVKLKSGGYLVINQTEALVAVDVNSGKSTRGRNIEQTATQTNLEAAEEACRQMRLRDLAGLVVIDFIDMDENKNNRAVEKKMKECLALDRARVHNGRISQFGLMEISRQRRRTGVLESSSTACGSCNGTGRQRSIESAALQLLRAIEARASGGGLLSLDVEAPGDVALYLLNNKRDAFIAIEEEAGLGISISSSEAMLPGDFKIDTKKDPSVKRRRKPKPLIEGDPDDEAFAAEIAAQDGEEEEEEALKEEGRRKRGRGRGRKSAEDGAESETSEASEDDGDDDEDSESGRKRRRRGRRGGRRRRRDFEDSDTAKAAAEATAAALALPAVDSKPATGKDAPPEDGGAYLDGLTMMMDEVLDEGLTDIAPLRNRDNAENGEEEEDRPKRRRRRGRRGGKRRDAEGEANAQETSSEEAVEETANASDESGEQTDSEDKPKRRRRRGGRGRKKTEETSETPDVEAEASQNDEGEAAAEVEMPKSEKPKRKPRSRKKATKDEPAKSETVTAEPPAKEPAVAVVSEAVETTTAEPKKRGWWSRKRG